MKKFRETTKDALSVSQYLDKINVALKNERARIIGEVSSVAEYPERSYLYFSIKDGNDQSTIKCFMWKRDFRLSGVMIKDGLEIIISAYPNVYKPNGSLTMQVETIELVGQGALQMAYEELKKRLTLEGLFSMERKKEIPALPRRIGVITSHSGAVISDFLTNIGKFGFEILFVDSKVEGQDAIKDLLLAIKTLKNKSLDVLVLMRGGGSLESFLAFNNEVLVRAVADFPAPVLTGLGHEKDAPLVSLASDKNVSTPTAVANMLNSTWIEWRIKENLSEEKILSNFTTLLERFKKAEETLLRSVPQIGFAITRIKENIFQVAKNLLQGFSLVTANLNDALKQYAKVIELSNPERQLTHGYSIVRSKGKVVRYVADVKSGDSMETSVSDGIIKSKAI